MHTPNRFIFIQKFIFNKKCSLSNINVNFRLIYTYTYNILHKTIQSIYLHIYIEPEAVGIIKD